MDDISHEPNENEDIKITHKAIVKGDIAPNWSSEEITLLNDLCSQKMHILDAKFDGTVTKSKKIRTWEEISTQIRALNIYPRTAAQCRKRWQNEKAKANKKVRNWLTSSRKTGGYFFRFVFHIVSFFVRQMFFFPKRRNNVVK